jgi:hypothetical protein
MKQSEIKLVLCIKNDGSEDLEKRKIYKVLNDNESEAEGLLRIIDDSGEDYLYPKEYFVPIHLSNEIQDALHFSS